MKTNLLAELKKCICKILSFFFCRLDLAGISAKTRKHQLIHTKFVVKSSFPIKWILVKAMLKTRGEHRSKFHCPIRQPYIYYQNYIPHIYQVVTKKRLICNAPLIFAVYTRIWNTCKCTPNHPFFVFVFSHSLRSLFHIFNAFLLKVALYFLRIFGSVIYPLKIKKERGMASQRLAGTWYIGNTVYKKSRQHTYFMERGMANRSIKISALAGPARTYMSWILHTKKNIEILYTCERVRAPGTTLFLTLFFFAPPEHQKMKTRSASYQISSSGRQLLADSSSSSRLLWWYRRRWRPLTTPGKKRSKSPR